MHHSKHTKAHPHSALIIHWKIWGKKCHKFAFKIIELCVTDIIYEWL